MGHIGLTRLLRCGSSSGTWIPATLPVLRTMTPRFFFFPVNRCISIWAGRTAGQQSSQLPGTAAGPIRLRSRANQAPVPGTAEPSPPAIFAMTVEYSSPEEPASSPVSSSARWSGAATWCGSSVPSESLHSLINFPPCHRFLLHNNHWWYSNTLWRTINMQILLGVSLL